MGLDRGWETYHTEKMTPLESWLPLSKREINICKNTSHDKSTKITCCE